MGGSNLISLILILHRSPCIGVSWNGITSRSSFLIFVNGIFPLKPSILGIPHLWNPPFDGGYFSGRWRSPGCRTEASQPSLSPTWPGNDLPGAQGSFSSAWFLIGLFFFLIGKPVGVEPPLWKIWRSVGMIRNPIYGKMMKHEYVPNHQQVLNGIW